MMLCVRLSCLVLQMSTFSETAINTFEIWFHKENQNGGLTRQKSQLPINDV